MSWSYPASCCPLRRALISIGHASGPNDYHIQTRRLKNSIPSTEAYYIPRSHASPHPDVRYESGYGKGGDSKAIIGNDEQGLCLRAFINTVNYLASRKS